MATVVLANRIAGGPYASTDSQIDVAAPAPVGTTYWNGVAYVTKYSYRRLRPGNLVGIVSSALAPGLGLDLSAMQVRVIATVVPCPSALAWHSPDPNNAEFLADTDVAAIGIGVPGARSLAATQGTRVTFTRPLDRVLTGASSSGQPTYDYLVQLEQTGPAATEAGLRFFGQSATTAPIVIGDKVIPILGSFAQFVPVAEGGDYPSISASVLGVEAATFVATGGRVSIFRGDEAVVVHHTVTVAPQTVANAQDINLGRERLAKVTVTGSNGAPITTGFTVNLVTGHIVFSSVAGYSQPVTIKHRIEDMLLVSLALEQTLSVARGVTHDFPSGSKVSSVLMIGDMQAKVHDGFQQATWTNVWSAVPIGTIPLAAYNEAAHPIVVTNEGAVKEWWAVIFTSATGFKVVGSQIGEVVAAGAGSTATNTAPINPVTGVPYFTIPATGWGTGWATGNVYRFSTDGANAPLNLIRSIAPSDPFVGQDKFTVALRGNVNA